jgi:hypothetical protein
MGQCHRSVSGLALRNRRIIVGGFAMALGHGIEHAVCSTRECENPAEFLIEWSNPKIHTGRTKKWLACADHRQFLIDYLRYRNFPYEVSDFSDSPTPSDSLREE